MLTPIPGFGLSFHNRITKQASNLSNQIESASAGEVEKRLADAYSAMEQPSGPSLLDVMQVIRYVVVILALSAAEFVLLGVIAFGLVSEAVCVLVGPIFIPFFVVPNLERLFWGWFKAFIQYAFYPVVANAFIFVFGEMLIHFLDTHPSPWNAQTIAALFVQLVFLLVAFIWGLLKVPYYSLSGGRALPGRRVQIPDSLSWADLSGLCRSDRWLLRTSFLQHVCTRVLRNQAIVPQRYGPQAGPCRETTPHGFEHF
jgi:TrbL/VirB6 plasmid conjugal transfer protein